MTRLTGPSRSRSIAAVAAGFLLTAALSLATDVVMHATGIFPPWGEPMSDRLFAVATAYRVVATVLGGYVTAALAPRRPIFHALVLAAIGTVVATIGLVATWNAGPALGPRWYPILLVVTAVPSVWLGGAARTRLARDRTDVSPTADVPYT